LSGLRLAAGSGDISWMTAVLGHPLAETMLARWLCAACGVEAPPGAQTIGPVEPDDRFEIAEAVVFRPLPATSFGARRLPPAC
jgi:hypothetical protein